MGKIEEGMLCGRLVLNTMEKYEKLPENTFEINRRDSL